jgi:hypothetical protein
MYFVNFANLLNNFMPRKYSKYWYNISEQLLKFGISKNNDNISLAYTRRIGNIPHKLKNLFTLQSIEKN